jgi:5-methylcytosine-specific restriction protein A
MPVSPPKPCRHPMCPELVLTPYCPAHSESMDATRYRGSSASRGYDSAWKRVRLQALRRDKYLCQHCLAVGRATVAVDVDHIIPLAVDPSRRLDLSNTQSLCRACHRIKSEQDKSIPRAVSSSPNYSYDVCRSAEKRMD